MTPGCGKVGAGVIWATGCDRCVLLSQTYKCSPSFPPGPFPGLPPTHLLVQGRRIGVYVCAWRRGVDSF